MLEGIPIMKTELEHCSMLRFLRRRNFPGIAVREKKNDLVEIPSQKKLETNVSHWKLL